METLIQTIDNLITKITILFGIIIFIICLMGQW